MIKILDKHSQLIWTIIINTILHVIYEDYIKFKDNFLKEERNQKIRAIPTFIKSKLTSYLKPTNSRKGEDVHCWMKAIRCLSTPSEPPLRPSYWLFINNLCMRYVKKTKNLSNGKCRFLWSR